MSDVATIIQRLGGQTKVGVICGFERNPGARGHDFKMRNAIPARYWPRIIAYAAENEIPGVTQDDLELAHNTRSRENCANAAGISGAAA